jgi:pyrroline-5-carboxylate reductase
MGTIGIIGAGNMGTALIRGLLQGVKSDSRSIKVFDIDPARVLALTKGFGISVVAGIGDVMTDDTAIVVLAVKPQAIGGVLDLISQNIHERLLIISIAAGISTSFILSRLKKPARIIRAMPNAAAIVGRGATALCKGGIADDSDLETALSLFSSIGHAVAIEEKMMNCVTALSASGLGYVFVMMEALSDAGVRMGLDRHTSRELTVQMFRGAAVMAESDDASLSDLKERITSPGGTTIAGLHVLERAGIRGILMDAVVAATLRADELAPKD